MATTEKVEKAEKTELAMPDALTISKAAGLVGPDKAQSFLDEVMFAGWGNLSDHHEVVLNIKELVMAAGDENNSQQTLAKDSLKKVQQVFKDYSK